MRFGSSTNPSWAAAVAPPIDHKKIVKNFIADIRGNLHGGWTQTFFLIDADPISPHHLGAIPDKRIAKTKRVDSTYRPLKYPSTFALSLPYLRRHPEEVKKRLESFVSDQMRLVVLPDARLLRDPDVRSVLFFLGVAGWNGSPGIAPPKSGGTRHLLIFASSKDELTGCQAKELIPAVSQPLTGVTAQPLRRPLYAKDEAFRSKAYTFFKQIMRSSPRSRYDALMKAYANYEKEELKAGRKPRPPRAFEHLTYGTRADLRILALLDKVGIKKPS